jgi:hypothetical protein
MQSLEVSGAVRLIYIYRSLGVKGLKINDNDGDDDVFFKDTQNSILQTYN